MGLKMLLMGKAQTDSKGLFLHKSDFLGLPGEREILTVSFWFRWLCECLYQGSFVIFF